MSRVCNITGIRFGRLVVISRQGSTKRGHSLWKCECDCGGVSVVAAYNLKNGHVTSCGCFRNELSSNKFKKANTTHGKYNSPTYLTWKSMIARCTNETHKSFKNYGGRGITVCERWLLFENFLCDMGSRPEGKTLDRIDSNKGYFKENCQWQTMREQQRNRRNNRIIKTPDGEMCVSEAAIHYGINKSTLLTRINNGLSEFDSCTTPVKSRGERHE